MASRFSGEFNKMERSRQTTLRKPGIVTRLADTRRGSSLAGARYRESSFWQIDQHDVGVFPQAIEHNLLAVGGDIEGPHGGVVAEMGEGPRLLRRQIQQPEVLQWKQPLHVNQPLAIRQEPGTLTLAAHLDFWQFHASPSGI